jgi:hypothetical protein
MWTSAVTPVTITNGTFLHAWNPKIVTDVVADFRSIRSEEQGVVKRIGSVKDITDAWTKDGIIDVHNELAFMASAAFSASGNRVLYGVNVDADLSNISTSYAEAIDEMSLIDCYSTVFGTTDGGINSLMAAYVNGQSDPYEAHERIGILTYDERDVYLMGSDSGTSNSSGVVTINGAFNLMTAGVTVDDLVEVYDTDGALVTTLTVMSTPSTATVAQTDGDTAYGAHTFRFLCGRKDAQAILAGALGAGERRVKVLWPGWFYAYSGSTRYLLPPYYIAAVRAGLDCGVIASQSMTNYDIALPGLSNIELGTNTYFRKAQLDDIGGGGVDIQIQDVRISQLVKSRHDLTSNMDAVELREWSITKQADVAAKTIRSAVAPYIGKYNITNNLINFLYKVCSIVCTKLVRDGILAKISVKSITRDDVIADKVNFAIEATVFVAGNYYDITLYVKSR